jgi:hypothetical protein
MWCFQMVGWAATGACAFLSGMWALGCLALVNQGLLLATMPGGDDDPE